VVSPPAPLTPAQRDACWTELAGSGEQAYGSLWKLVQDPGTLDLLRKELPPVPAAPDAKVLEMLLADLDSDRFAVRTRAHDQLAALGPAAEGPLRKVLSGKPSAEVRRSVEDVLRTLAGQQVRGRRAIEVLETRNTSAARQLLETLAQGAADAWLTREARETLERLSKKPVRTE